MFRGSNAQQYIDIAGTLPLFNQEALFLKYTGIMPTLNGRFTSLFRRDTMPGCRFVWRSGILYFVDNRGHNGKIFFNIVDTISVLYNVTAKKAINMIVADNEIGGITYQKHLQDKVAKTKPMIRFKYQAWAENNYFGIKPYTLEGERVYHVTEYWIKDGEEWKYNHIHNPSRTLTIAYLFENQNVKLYFPNEKFARWYTNCTPDDVFGAHKLDYYFERDPSLIIYTKSQKDRLLLDHVYGYNAIAAQSETSDIPSSVVQSMKRFDHQLILYDHDNTGQIYAGKLSERHNIPWINLGIAKDVFEATQLYGVENTNTTLKQLTKCI